jgi:hypothetical protein
MAPRLIFWRSPHAVDDAVLASPFSLEATATLCGSTAKIQSAHCGSSATVALTQPTDVAAAIYTAPVDNSQPSKSLSLQVHQSHVVIIP